LFDDDPERAKARLRERLMSGVRGTAPEFTWEASKPKRIVVASSFDQLLREVSQRHAVPPEALGSRGRTLKVSAARRELAARAAAELGLSGAEIGRRLGVTTQAVSLMLTRGTKPTS
jgi:hypothetical protein